MRERIVEAAGQETVKVVSHIGIAEGISLRPESGNGGVHRAAGPSADLLLQNREFEEAWKDLCDRCPWSTAFQTSGFAMTWYRAYQTLYTPVIVSNFASGAGMSGLLALAVSKKSGDLVMAGAHQAEYQAWIAIPSFSDSFILEALRILRAAYPDRSVLFKYLPPLTPIGWTNAHQHGSGYCLLQAHRRPLMALDSSGADKSKNRLLNRFARQGKLSFEKIGNVDGLARVLDALIPHYDLRQGAVNGVTPFHDDPLKGRFHLDLMAVPGLLHVVALKLDDTFIAAHLGVCDRKTVYVGIMTHSAFYSKHSPGTLLIKMLAAQVAQEGYSYLDLTPGGGYKERFATGHDEVHTLRVFFGRFEFRANRARERLLALAKGRSKSATVSSLLKRLRTLRIIDFASRVSALKLWLDVNLHVYACSGKDLPQVGSPQLLSKNQIEDFFVWYSTKRRQSKSEFYAKCLGRVEDGLHFYTRVESGCLTYGAYVALHQEKLILDDLEQEIRLPCDSAVIFNLCDRLEEKKAGLGIAALHQILAEAIATSPTGPIYVILDAKDTKNRRAAQALGLALVGRFQRTSLFGITLSKTTNNDDLSKRSKLHSTLL